MVCCNDLSARVITRSKSFCRRESLIAQPTLEPTDRFPSPVLDEKRA